MPLQDAERQIYWAISAVLAAAWMSCILQLPFNNSYQAGDWRNQSYQLAGGAAVLTIKVVDCSSISVVTILGAGYYKDKNC